MNSIMSIWQLQDAKSKFSQLVEKAITNGPQFVTKRGVEAVVVVSKEKYVELTKQKNSLVELLKNTPKVNLDLKRSKESIRDLEFLNPWP
jgi:antitoxin Phd